MASFTITRTNGDAYTVLCDDEDLARIQAVGAWRLLIAGRGRCFYAQHSRPGKSPWLLHRFVMRVDDKAVGVRIRNGNGLDVRKSNLVVGERMEFSKHKRTQTRSVTGAAGVHAARNGRGFDVRYWDGDRNHYLGRFPTVDEGRGAREQKLREIGRTV